MKKIKGTKGEQEARRVTILMAARLTRSPVADAPVAVGAVHGVASVHWNLLSAALEPTTSTLVVGADWSSRAYQLSPGYSTPCHLLNGKNICKENVLEQEGDRQEGNDLTVEATATSSRSGKKLEWSVTCPPKPVSKLAMWVQSLISQRN